jgi:hypothetical protein
MSSLIEMVTEQLAGGAMQQISGQLGADEATTGKAMAAALPLLLGALSRNAAQGGGAESLHRALANDHDGSILDDLGSFLGQGQSGAGDGILRHTLGSKRGTVERRLGASTGLDAGTIAKLLPMLAPIVMAALGKVQRAGNLDAQGLAGLLGGETETMARQHPNTMGFLGQLLDADDDGDVDLSDIAGQGLGFLNNLMGGR